jgi:AcrR family transcriptional regulator
VRRDGAANRESILLAAEQVFGKAGADASTEEVARRAEVGIATVFRHFPTKRDLVEATAVRYLEKLEGDVRGLLDADDAAAAFATLMRTVVASGNTKVTLLNMLLTHDEGLTEPVLAAVQGFRGATQLVLDNAQSVGAIRPDVTIEEIFTLTRALAHVATPEQKEAVDRAVQIVLDGLGVARN